MRPLLFLLAFIIAVPASAQVYRWTDENGVTHFGTQPPPGQQDEVRIRDNRASDQGGSTESDIVRRARELDRQRQAQSDAHQRQQNIRGFSDRADNRPDYVCTGAENRLKSARERWSDVRRQGYRISDQRYHEQRIRELQRHRDNVCR